MQSGPMFAFQDLAFSADHPDRVENTDPYTCADQGECAASGLVVVAKHFFSCHGADEQGDENDGYKKLPSLIIEKTSQVPSEIDLHLLKT